MKNRPVISVVLNAHTPFVRHPELADAPQERWFFDAVSDVYIPLLEVFDRLDMDHIPFRMGLSLSPVLCHMLDDEYLIGRYLEYTGKRIEFGARELERHPEGGGLFSVIKHFYDRMIDKRALFTTRYEGNILKVFEHYQRKGWLELLTTAATHAFLPFYVSCPEAVQAEFEAAIGAYRSRFGKYPQGFWLPELGWTNELAPWLRAYNFAYTIIDSHGLVLGSPNAEKGTFYPAKTQRGVFVLGRDFYAREDIEAMTRERVYRDNCRDLGYELPLDHIKSFLDAQGGRTGTGYKCWASGGDTGGASEWYNPARAAVKAKEQAAAFLSKHSARLSEAAALMDKQPLCLCAFDADSFGRRWYEGPAFLEALFREAAASESVQFMTPAEYIFKQNAADFQTLNPAFSSWGVNGYAETWVDASNDWMYPHTMRAIARMIEMADRFPGNSGLKDRTLNQAAREILLVMASDWPKMLYREESTEYARRRIEEGLKNFTAIYEALGSNHVSTEWLTILEKRHNIFPHINYRVFRKKR
jgi:1,4-alpha-glucan branching enzyme